MSFSMLGALIYLLIGLSVVYLFRDRRSRLSRLRNDQIPELGEEGFRQFVTLLKTAYERMLYTGIMFFPLAFTTYRNDPLVSKLFFLALIFLLFLSNIPPRHRIMRRLDEVGLNINELKTQGIRL